MAKEIWYQKLVRNKIPAFIEAQKESPITRILDEEAFIKQLKCKLQEEVTEFFQTVEIEAQLEELADILEVVYVLGTAKDFTKEALEKIRLEKARRKGTFEGRIFLEKKVINGGL